MEIVGALLVLGIVAIVLYGVFGKGDLASAMRARFRGEKAEFASKIDSATARFESADATNDSQLAKINKTAIEAATIRRGLQVKYDRAVADEANYSRAAENAAQKQKPELVKAALERRNQAHALTTTLKPALDTAIEQERKVNAIKARLESNKQALSTEKATARTRASAARATIEVNQLDMDFDENGVQSDLAKGRELLDEIEARAAATSDVAAASQSGRAVDDELKALMDDQPDVDEEAEALLARYNQASTRLSAESATGNDVTQTLETTAEAAADASDDDS